MNKIKIMLEILTYKIMLKEIIIIYKASNNNNTINYKILNKIFINLPIIIISF